MSKTTYPVFGEMLPTSEDIQLIVDSFKEEDRKRLTADGVFNPGIVNEIDEYLKEGSQKNTLRILPFIGYTKSGNRIEVESEYNYLMPQKNGQIIIDNTLNLVNRTKDVPYWIHYSKNYTNFTEATGQQFSILIDLLKPGSILQGIKLKHVQKFSGAGDVFVSIGVGNPIYNADELKNVSVVNIDKFTPEFEISVEPTNEYVETSNIAYSEYNVAYIPIYATFTCSTGNLNNLTSGSLNISLCVTEVSNVEYKRIDFDEGGIVLSKAIGSWEPDMIYYIVARYKTIESDSRSITITDDDIDLEAEEFNARQTDSFEFYALRRTGSIIDPLTDDDIKLGKVISDSQSNITIYINDFDESSKTYHTDYLTLPNSRFRDFSNKIVNLIENFDDVKVNKSGDTMTGNLTLKNSSINIDGNINIDGSINIDGVNNYSIKQDESGKLKILSENKGIYLKEDNRLPFYTDGQSDYKLLTNKDSDIVEKFVKQYLEDKDYVIEHNEDDTGNWYRIYKSGWIEQGGTTTTAVETVTFPKKLQKGRAMTINCTPLNKVNNYENFHIYNVTNTGFKIGAKYQPEGHTVSWEVKGYIESEEMLDEE